MTTWSLVVALATGCIYVNRPVFVPVPAPAVAGSKPARPAILFVTGRDSENHWSSPQIYRAEATGANPVNLTSDAFSNGSPSLSPDGREMVFVSSRDRTHQLYVMDLDTRDVRAIATDVGQIQAPHWSGHDIAFAAPAYTAGTAIHMIDDQGGTPWKITDPGPHEQDDGGLAFIDHGQRIVFSRYDDRTQDRDLYVVTADGSTTRRITESPHVTETLPVTSHDGRLLAYRATRMDKQYTDSIRIVEVGTWALVADIALPPPVKWNVNGIDFSAGDRGLVFGADASDVGGSLVNLHAEIFAIDLDGTHLRRITKNAAFDGQPVSLLK